MINCDSIFIPDTNCGGEKIRLPRSVCAVQIVIRENGTKLGPLTHLKAGTTIELCGEGYNERTAKVRVKEEYFFVFLQDLEAPVKN